VVGSRLSRVNVHAARLVVVPNGGITLFRTRFERIRPRQVWRWRHGRARLPGGRSNHHVNVHKRCSTVSGRSGNYGGPPRHNHVNHRMGGVVGGECSSVVGGIGSECHNKPGNAFLVVGSGVQREGRSRRWVPGAPRHAARRTHQQHVQTCGCRSPRPRPTSSVEQYGTTRYGQWLLENTTPTRR